MKRIVVRLSGMPFGLASAVNWSRRCRLRQIRGKPQPRTSAETRESFGSSPSAPAGQGGLALPISAEHPVAPLRGQGMMPSWSS
jgi:hypothetical protein